MSASASVDDYVKDTSAGCLAVASDTRENLDTTFERIQNPKPSCGPKNFGSICHASAVILMGIMLPCSSGHACPCLHLPIQEDRLQSL